jgi:hypothetical protein
MDTIEFIRELIADAHNQADDSMKGTTSKEFNWAPPGTANPISAILVHHLASEDFFIQSIIRGVPELWEKGGWSGKTGVKNVPAYGGNWDEFKHKTVAMEPVLSYQQAVRTVTDSYLKTLTPTELERKVKFAGEEQTVASVLSLLARHVIFHSGEIAALKGAQGSKGLPY